MARPPGRSDFPSGGEPWGDRGPPGPWATGPFTEFSSTVTVISTNTAPSGATPKTSLPSPSPAMVSSPSQSSSSSSPSQPTVSSPSHSSSTLSAPSSACSSMSSSLAPQSTPALQFSAFPSFTTCVNSTIKWSYAGPSSSPMNLSVVTAQTSSGWSLVSGLNPMSEEWEWEVTIAGGPYLLQAVVGSDAQLQQFNSEPFSVSNGTDLSCLSTSNLTPTSVAIIPTSSVVASPSPPSTNASNVNTDGHQANAGAIAGGVIGAIALLGIMLGILLHYSRWHCTSSERTIQASPSTIERGRSTLFAVAPFDDHSTPSRFRDVKAKSSDTMMSSQIITPEYIVSLGATLRSHTDTSDKLVTPQDSASQRRNEEQHRSLEPSVSHFMMGGHDLPSSEGEETHSETNLLPPPLEDSPTLPAPVHHVDSGMRFSTVTPSELAVLDIPPTYTPD